MNWINKIIVEIRFILKLFMGNWFTLQERLDYMTSMLWVKSEQYCICWSGDVYKDCCEVGITNQSRYNDKSMYKELEKWFDILINKKVNDEGWKKKFAEEIDLMISKRALKKWIFVSCISPNCRKPAIQSHLFPRRYLKKLQNEWYQFRLPWVNKALWADSFKMHLRCWESDRNLFQKTDAINDIRTVFDIQDESRSMKETMKSNEIMWEFMLKTFFFKYKTDVVNLMIHFYKTLMFWDLYDFKRRRRHIKELKRLYNKFNLIHKYYKSDSIFFQSKDWPKIHFPMLSWKTYSLSNSEWEIEVFDKDIIYYATNIKVIDGVPVFIASLNKDWIRTCYIWATVWDESKEMWKWEKILKSINDEIDIFVKEKDLDGFENYIHKLFFSKDNPIYYINPTSWYVWNTFILWRKK